MISLNSKRLFQYPVGPKLFGIKKSKNTNSVLQILDTSSIEYEFIDIRDIESIKGEMMFSLTGSTELPQLFDGGESYVGYDQIRNYVRK